PAAISAANARYGFTSAPGMRVSTRRLEPCPTTRKPQVRLSRPQASVVGAQLPTMKRLYELIVGARKIASSHAHAICPARKWRNSSVSPANAFSSPRHRLAWMWHEDPTSVWYGLAMKVIEHSCWCAISLAPFLKTTWLSAVRRASAYLKLISCC